MGWVSSIAYDESATCPLWISFLQKVTQDNGDLIKFLQKAVGYSLTGSIREQCFFLLHGTGENGKSTFIKTVGSLLSEYASATRIETLMVKRGDSIPNDIARLAGLRFVSALESEGGKRLAESLVKQLTGGDTVVARFLHREFFEFEPTFKLWLGVNHKPKIVGTDWAIWRRVKMIPFETKITDDEKDLDFGEKLKGELRGILRWAMDGCALWLKDGLKAPEAVKSATQNYRNEMDAIGNFINECCDLDPDVEASKSELYKAYMEWAKGGGEWILSKNEFGTRMLERGFEEKRKNKKRFWAGITVESDA
jgi:putative DNA primase/helicase